MSNKLKAAAAFIAEHVLPWFILVILLLYTYAKIFEHPYLGFRWDEHNDVIFVFVQGNLAHPLLLGDHLIAVGNARLDDFDADYRATFAKEAQAGRVVPLVIERGGQRQMISWVMPGMNRMEFWDMATSEFWLSYVFWLVGTLTLLHLRPRNGQRNLLIAFDYLTALWIMFGGGASFYHLWYSAFLLRIFIWFCVPLYLHFHWSFPRPLGKLPGPLIGAGYGMAGVLAIAECFQLLGSTSYLFGFLLAIGGSFILLIVHLIVQPDVRRDLRFVLFGFALPMALTIATGIILSFAVLPGVAALGLIGLPFIPISYFYSAFRRQFVDMELRINRFISVYLFLVLLALVVFSGIVAANLWIAIPGAVIPITAAACTVTALISVLGYPPFESLVEHRLLGIPFSHRNLQEIYSTRITTSPSIPQLAALLKDEIMPSLLVRQFSFLQVEGGNLKALVTAGVDPEEVPGEDGLARLLPAAGRYRPAAALDADAPCPWARLILPLNIGGEVIGVWLLGRRDPDDLYSQADIAVMGSLANQTAIALSNILQTDRLRKEYEANINRSEDERLRLALDLHDSVLNQMAAMMMYLDAASITPSFQAAYDRLTQRLREIVSNLRPPMLNYGLEPAFKEFADNLMQRSKDTVSVVADLHGDGTRYPQNIEHHLFRIVQEACENSLRHARCKRIIIFGHLTPGEIELRIHDDGAGFELMGGAELDALLANRHFGLVGIVERARLIGAQVNITTAPGNGTQIHIDWRPADGI